MTQTTTTRSSSRRDSSRPAPLPAGGDLGAQDARQEGTSKPFQTVYTIVERERDGQKFWLTIGAAWWMALFPSAAILLTVLAYNYLGESLQRRIEGHR